MIVSNLRDVNITIEYVKITKEKVDIFASSVLQFNRKDEVSRKDKYQKVFLFCFVVLKRSISKRLTITN